MKYSILGFNQEKIINYKILDTQGRELICDLTDLLLLNYIIYAQANPKMRHYMDDENIPCVWLNHTHLLHDLPILQITEGTLKNRLTKLRKMNLITSITIANENNQGSNTYYRITSLLNDMLFETTSLKNDVVNEPRHLKMTSNTQVNLDTQVNKVLISKDISTRENFLGSSSKKQSNNSLYSKCIAMLDDFVVTHNLDNEVRKQLIEYLNFRLQVKDKPLYANMWKGMLNKLATLHSEGHNVYDIIQFCIERGYLSFYPPSDNTNSKVRLCDRDVITTEPTEQDRKWLREMKEKGEVF